MNDRANTRTPIHNNSTTYKTYHTRRNCAFLIAEVWTNETGMRETTPLICVQKWIGIRNARSVGVVVVIVLSLETRNGLILQNRGVIQRKNISQSWPFNPLCLYWIPCYYMYFFLLSLVRRVESYWIFSGFCLYFSLAAACWISNAMLSPQNGGR